MINSAAAQNPPADAGGTDRQHAPRGKSHRGINGATRSRQSVRPPAATETPGCPVQDEREPVSMEPATGDGPKHRPSLRKHSASLPRLAVSRADGDRPAFEFVLDVGRDHFFGKSIGHQARHRIGVDAEKAAIARVADERPAWLCRLERPIYSSALLYCSADE